MSQAERTNPLAIAAGLALVAVFLFFALPPVIGFLAFLFAGDTWRALTGAALICFLLGLALAAAIGFFERGRPPDASGEAPARRTRGPLWTLVWLLILAAPACLLVALVASGTLLDVIDWVGDRVSEIRGAQGSS